MPPTPLFPLPEGLEMTSISDTPEELLVCVTSHRASSPCPQCATPSSAIHSYYHRPPPPPPPTPPPLPSPSPPPALFSPTPNCSPHPSAERLPAFTEPSSPLTT